MSVKIEIILKLASETINSAGNIVRHYDVYALDSTTVLGISIITLVQSTTPSVAAIGSSSGSLVSSNSNESNAYLQYQVHTVLYIEEHHYVFDSSYVMNNNDFIISKNITKSLKNKLSEKPAAVTWSMIASSPAKVASTNELTGNAFWAGTISNMTPSTVGTVGLTYYSPVIKA